VLDDSDVLESVWSLLWSGHLTNDTIAPLRALLAGGRTAHKRTRTAPRQSRYAGRRGALGRFGGLRGGGLGAGLAAVPGAEGEARGGPGAQERVAAAETSARAASLRAGAAAVARSGPPTGVGRWTRLPDAVIDATTRAVTSAELLLDRYGILTRGSVVAEDIPGGFAAVYRVLAAAEEAGKVRRGYFVESLGASQFASTGAVDRLRATSRLPGSSEERSRVAEVEDEWAMHPPAASRGAGRRRQAGPSALVLAACDPANPYGAALGWPERPVTDAGEDDDKATGGVRRGHQPGRKAGALVVLVEGELALYVERGGKTMLCWSDDEQALQAAADALALAVREGALGRLTVEKADGSAILGSGHPLVTALSKAGFHMTPRGLRLRR
jgi:ATP-dependent Lhr-like helicase